MPVSESYRTLALPPLPVQECLDDLVSALREKPSAVLVAPPGAGKTSRVPLALLDEPWNQGKRLIVLEPRRLAARAAAEHMAGLIGERPGGRIGYRVRMDSRTGPDTRIEFVTEGVFTRMVLDDPELAGIGGVLFDEFHERNLESDLGLALALDVQASLREDLRILPMSATLDGVAVAKLLDDCPVIESKGRSFPVEIIYRPRKPDSRLEDEMAAAIRSALAQQEGGILCFLPGQGEIIRTAERLSDLPETIELHRLYGAMKPEDQRSAIAPAKPGRRKVVLATSIAQTSLTLDGVRVIIDSGLARVPRHEPATGLTRLETVRASRNAVAQRAGRAGRTQPGMAIRLWHEGQNAAMPEQDRAEILEAELSNLVLDLASWGVNDPGTLKWLDLPPERAWNAAVQTLQQLGALDGNGHITGSGGQLREMPLPPRLGHMVHRSREFGAAERAAQLALLISERGVGGNDTDLEKRLENLCRSSDPRTKSVKASARNIAGKDRNDPSVSVGLLVSLAWPERIARKMGNGPNGEAQYLLANGRRALLDGLSPLARAEWLAICEIQGSAAAGRILSAGELTPRDLLAAHGETVRVSREVELEEKSGRFNAWQTRRLGAIALSRERTAISAEDNISERTLQYIRDNGLGGLIAGDRTARLLSRLGFLHHHFGERFRPVDETSLVESTDEWLAPMLAGTKGPGDLDDARMLEAVRHYAGHQNLSEIDRLAPERWILPTGNAHVIDYEGETAALRGRVQEFFGMKTHPSIGEGSVPLVLELLSPAMRPLQKTLDIARFWEGSWRDVRKDMRGRYPRHVWPEDPANAEPTSRAKPRS